MVDAGNLYSKSARVRDADRPQQVEKARLLAAGYGLVGVDALLPGDGDLALGLSLVQELAALHNLPYVATNLECGGVHPFPALRSIESGGLRVALVGVLGNSVKAEGCHVTEPVAAVGVALQGVQADLVVILSGQKIGEDEALAAALPGVALIVNGHDRQQLESPRPLSDGGLLLGSGSRGKQVGAVSLTLVPGATRWRDGQIEVRVAEQRDRRKLRIGELQKRRADAAEDATRQRLDKQIAFFEKEIAESEAELQAARTGDGPVHLAVNRLLDLGAAVADHAATALLVTAAKTAIAAVEPEAPPGSALLDSPFAGSSACTGCHPGPAAQWGATAHARAYASLQASARERDRACFSCHVTGALHPDGPKEPGAVAGLESVGCEACHGPGRAHVSNPPTVELIAKPDLVLCRGCHDSDQDGGRFDPEAYLSRVAH